MKFVIDFNEDTNIFNVSFERNETSGDPWPPPPPYNDQLKEMTTWLNECYPDVCKKFADKEVSGLKLTFQASAHKQ